MSRRSTLSDLKNCPGTKPVYAKAARHDPFFEMSFDPLWIASMDGTFRRVNAAFSKALGHPELYLRSIRFVDLAHPSDRNSAVVAWAGLKRGQPVDGLCTRFLRSGGDFVPFSWRAARDPKSGLIHGVSS